MSSFTSPADLRLHEQYKWELLAAFTYYLDEPTGEAITVPVGFITDLATVPRPLWVIFPPHGRYAKAAIIHDFLYVNAIGKKVWADQVFFDAMSVLKVPKLTRWLLYYSVRLFGKGAYKK